MEHQDKSLLLKCIYKFDASLITEAGAGEFLGILCKKKTHGK